MVVPLPLWVTAPERMLPAIVALPEPEFRKVPLPRARLLEATKAPALVLVNEEAVSVPPARVTVPVVLVTITVPAVIPELVTVIVAVEPKVALSLVEKAWNVPVNAAFVDHTFVVVFQFPEAPPAQ